MSGESDNRYHIPESAFVREDNTRAASAANAVRNNSAGIFVAAVLLVCLGFFLCFDDDYEFKYFKKRSFNRRLTFAQKKKSDAAREKALNSKLTSRLVSAAGFVKGGEGPACKSVAEYFNADGSVRERINYGVARTDAEGNPVRYNETKTVFKYSADGVLASSKATSNFAGGPNQTAQYKFDAGGNMIEISVNDPVYSSFVEKFNERGEIYERIAGKNVEKSTRTERNKDGKVVRETLFSSIISREPEMQTMSEFKYDGNGNLESIYTTVYTEGKTPLYYEETVFDDQGYPIQWRHIPSGWLGTTNTKKSYYDENGNLTETRLLTSSSRAEDRLEYDAKGNLTLKRNDHYVLKTKGSGKSSRTVKIHDYSLVENYKYDNEGFLILKTETENGKPKRIFHYDYEKRR